MRHLPTRRLVILGSGLAALAGGPALAATEIPYSQSAFDAAQKANDPILVWVHASWCPTCAKQGPILDKIEAEPAYKNLKVFKVDFDSQKDVVRKLGVQMQSTLIAYRGDKEMQRSTGQTSEAAIREVVGQAVG